MQTAEGKAFAAYYAVLEAFQKRDCLFKKAIFNSKKITPELLEKSEDGGEHDRWLTFQSAFIIWAAENGYPDLWILAETRSDGTCPLDLFPVYDDWATDPEWGIKLTTNPDTGLISFQAYRLIEEPCPGYFDGCNGQEYSRILELTIDFGTRDNYRVFDIKIGGSYDEYDGQWGEVQFLPEISSAS